MPNARIWQALFYLALVTVLVLSLLPIEHPDVSPNDKVNHIIAYAGLTVLAYLAHRHRLFGVMGVVAFGALVEVLQGFTGYRFMSFGDILANGGGALVGSVVSFPLKSSALSSVEK